MSQEVIKYNPRYQVMLCTLCTISHCVPLGNIGKHLQVFHSDSLSKEQRKKLVQYAQIFKDETMDPAQVKLITPPFEEGPIQGLHKVHGFECTVCKYLVPKETSMKKHCYRHGWDSRKPQIWTRKWMQVYLDSNLITNVSDFLCKSSVSKVLPSQRT